MVLLLAAVAAAAASELAERPALEALEVTPGAVAAPRKLLREEKVAGLEAIIPSIVSWGRQPGKVILPAGSYVQFYYSRGSGIGYGTAKCSFSQTFVKSAGRSGSLLIRIPRGTSWFGDPTGKNCNSWSIMVVGI